MKDISGKVIAFISSLIVGFLIIINIKLSTLPVSKQLSAKEYKEAIDERNKLFKELEILKEENYTTKNKINSYVHDDKKDEKVVSDMLSQLNDYGMISGLSAVKGPGVVIKITDGPNEKINETRYETLSKIFHDSDAVMVLNEIKLAGAEAIAINNHRIIPSTGMDCGWAFIEFDDDTLEPGPFYYYAIGDPEQLMLNLNKEGSYINKLIIRKLKVEIEMKDEIILPASSQSFDTKFMEEAINK